MRRRARVVFVLLLFQLITVAIMAEGSDELFSSNKFSFSNTSTFGNASSFGLGTGSYIDNYVNNLETGGLIYNPSKEMTISLTQTINATITKESGLGEGIKVSPIMEVYLRGPTFRIDPITESRQFVANTGPTVWKWYVTPNMTGYQQLDLLAYVIVEMPDGHEERRALVKDRTILVKVNPLETPAPISIISIPPDADVIVDDVPKGTTPKIISDLPLGDHKLILKHSGYNDYNTTIQVKPYAYNLTYKLEPEPSLLSNPYIIGAFIAALATIIVGYLTKKK